MLKKSQSKPTPSHDLGDLSSSLVGASGAYFVAGELSRRGHIASLTIRNARGIDILATNTKTSRLVNIQVKTNRGARKQWMLSEKDETVKSDRLFYVFVNLIGPEQHPEYHVVPSKVVASRITKEHRKWSSTPGRKGQLHQHSSVRIFRDYTNKYRDRWSSLGL
jgi:hypothetical protein